MFSLVVFAVLIATSLAKPTDSVVSVNQDSLGNFDINYKIEDISRKHVAVIEPHLRSEHILRSAELATPTLIAQPKVELPSYRVLEVPAVQTVPQISTLRSSQFTSLQQEVPVVAERKIELPAYKVLDIPEVRAVAQPKIEIPQYRVVQVPELPEVRSSHLALEREIPVVAERRIQVPVEQIQEVPVVRSSQFTSVQREIPVVAERKIEVPTYKLVSVPEIPEVRSSHFTVQKEIPLVAERRLDVPSYRVVEVPSVRSELLPVHQDGSLVSIPSHSFLRTVPDAHIGYEKHFVH